MLYVESFGNPEHFTRVAGRVARRKPILVIKGRRSAERSRSQPRSQTARALRGDAVIDAVLRQAGVLRFDSSQELFDVAQLFESQPLPSGRRVAIVSNSTSVATLVADACATRGLGGERRSAERRTPGAVGLGAGALRVRRGGDELLGGPGIDALMVCYVDRLEGDPEGVLDAISAVSSGQPKPVVASVVRSDGAAPSSGSGAPNFPFPELRAAVLGAPPNAAPGCRGRSACARSTPAWTGRRRARSSLHCLIVSPAGGWLSLAEMEALLATHGIPFAASYPCRDLELCGGGGAEIGAPVALKADFARARSRERD